MANADDTDPDIVDAVEVAADEATRSYEYWTAEALAAAEPLDPDASDFTAFETDGSAREGEEVVEEPYFAGGKRRDAWDPQPKCIAGRPNTERVPNRSIIPYAPVGKLFMTFGTTNYVGSAWVIDKSAVFTAGHCLFNRKIRKWAKNVLFVPQYHMGTEPLGRWAAIRLASLEGWTKHGDFKYDLAAFKVDRPIQPMTGSLGWIANAKPNLGCITGIGYPAVKPFDGNEMWRSTGKNLGGSNPIQAYNNMTPGCSGGPWEIWKKGVPLTNGVNSFRKKDKPKTMYSPYFGKGFLKLAKWAK